MAAPVVLQPQYTSSPVLYVIILFVDYYQKTSDLQRPGYTEEEVC